MLKQMTMTRPRAAVAWTAVFGVLAGLLAATYFSVAGEPAIDEAIAIEEAMAAENGHDHDHDDGHGDSGATDEDEGHSHDEQVSRDTQRGAGLFAGYGLLGAALGVALAVTALALRGSWLEPFTRFLLAGGLLAVAVTVVPWFKYPPNPPAVGDESTVGSRTFSSLLLTALAVVILAGAAHLSSRLRTAGWDGPRRVATVAVAAVLGIAALMTVMPADSTTIPEEMPASLVWRFRTASLLGNILLWSSLTLLAASAYHLSTTRQTTPDP